MKRISLAISFLVSILTMSFGQKAVGIQLGSLWMQGDVTTETQRMNSIGFTYNQSLYSKIEWGLGFSQSKTTGFEFNLHQHKVSGGILDLDLYQIFTGDRSWFPAYSLNLTSLQSWARYYPFRPDDALVKRLDLFIGGGFGMYRHHTHVDILGENGHPYFFSGDDKIFKVDEIKAQYDENYETSLDNQSGFTLGGFFSFGFLFQANKDFGIAVSANSIFLGTDYLDGIRQTNQHLFGNKDILYLYQFEIRRSL